MNSALYQCDIPQQFEVWEYEKNMKNKQQVNLATIWIMAGMCLAVQRLINKSVTVQIWGKIILKFPQLY